LKIKLFALLALLAFGIAPVIGCGGGGGSSPLPAPDLTGEWIGNFVSEENVDSFEISFVISSQDGDSFDGTWINRSGAIIYAGVVDGYVYLSNDGRWLVDLSLSWGSVTCCVPLFGCSDLQEESLNMLGFFESEAIIDEATYHSFICSGETGTLIVSRQHQ
jgi:hypothetical protein